MREIAIVAGVLLVGGCVVDEAALGADAAFRGDAAGARVNPCGEEGVEVEVGGARYCALPDLARLPCPPERPVRVPARGIAVCGGAAVDPNAAAEVARAALVTGELLAPQDITAVEMPEAARTWPGAPAQTPVEATVTVVDYGGPWFTPDGAPTTCRTTFDHFETERAGDDLRLTAWDSVTCGPGLTNGGTVEHEEFPATLDGLSPGLHAVLFSTAYDDEPRRAPYMVALEGVCGARRPLAACFRGFFFAECGGADEPALWCEHGDRGCLWFTGGCPAEGFDLARACNGDPYCPNPHMGWGAAPWDRARDVELEVGVDGEVAAAEAPAVECDCEEAPCLGRGYGLCNPALAEAYIVRPSPRPDADDWGLPSFVAWTLFADGPELGLTNDAGLLVEIDPGSGRARACLVQTSDGGHGGPPVCAEAGVLRVDRRIEAVTDVAAVHGDLTASFPAAPPAVPQAITLRARW